MGGSGSRGYFRNDPIEIVKDVRDAKTRSEQYDTAANDVLRSYISDANDRDTAAIQGHLDEIKSALGKEIKGSIDLRFGGSVAKHTYVEGLSDVDSLVLLDSCDLADRPPQEARAYFTERLRERFPKTEITEGTLAVTVKFKDAEIQLLPAVSCRDRVRIAASNGQEWAEINPEGFASTLTRVNESVAGKVIPTIKLAKTIIGQLPERQRLTGYHAESIGIEAFQGYKGSVQAKDLVRHYFSDAANRVLEPIRDRTGQSVHVDEYLGPAGSVERRVVSDALARVARRMANADATESISDWRRLFGE